MYFIEELKRIQKLHRLIDNQCTGSPDDLAALICISRRDLYYILQQLKRMGAQIRYNRARKTFCYTNNFNLNMEIKISCLGEKEMDLLGSGNVNTISEFGVPCNSFARNVYF